MMRVQIVVVALGVMAASSVFAQGKGPETKGPTKAEGKGPDGKGPPAGDAKGAAKADAKGGPAAGAPMDPAAMFPKPGPETKALAPLVGNMKMAGTMKAGAMGPGSPEMATAGTHNCKWTKDQLWLDCDVKSGPTADKKAQPWMGHIHVGYDYQVKAYRSVMVDNMGVAALMEGKLDGQKLTLESVGTYMMMGKPIKSRITIDMTDPKAVKFMGEMQMDGKWMVTDEATMTKGGAKKAAE
jgi:hypothetical protein